MVIDGSDRRFVRAYIPLMAATRVTGYQMVLHAVSAHNIIHAFLRDTSTAEPIHIDTYDLLPDAELIRIAKQQVEWALQRPEAMDPMRKGSGGVEEFLCRADAALRVIIARYDK